MNVFEDAMFQDLETHIALFHVEEFLPFLQMVILSLVWSSNIEYLKMKGEECYLKMLDPKINGPSALSSEQFISYRKPDAKLSKVQDKNVP